MTPQRISPVPVFAPCLLAHSHTCPPLYTLADCTSARKGDAAPPLHTLCTPPLHTYPPPSAHLPHALVAHSRFAPPPFAHSFSPAALLHACFQARRDTLTCTPASHTSLCTPQQHPPLCTLLSVPPSCTPFPRLCTAPPALHSPVAHLPFAHPFLHTHLPSQAPSMAPFAHPFAHPPSLSPLRPHLFTPVAHSPFAHPSSTLPSHHAQHTISALPPPALTPFAHSPLAHSSHRPRTLTPLRAPP